jgi:ABC-2 type transport system ATP-binding protein
MSILTAQNFATSGEVRVFGENPYENSRVLGRICFVRESQRYPDDARPVHAFRMAAMFFPHWNQDLADELIDAFQLPMKTRIKKLSRGQLSAVGVIIGLASRAEHVLRRALPRTGCRRAPDLLRPPPRRLRRTSPHDRAVQPPHRRGRRPHRTGDRHRSGRIILDEETDAVRGRASTIIGDAVAVDAFTAGARCHRESLGRVASATVLGELDTQDRAQLAASGLEVGAVSLQQLIVRHPARRRILGHGERRRHHPRRRSTPMNRVSPSLACSSSTSTRSCGCR